MIGLLGQGVEPALEALKVADGLSLVDRGMQPGDSRPGLARGQVGGRDPPFEQVHLGSKRVVPASEELKRFVRTARLPDSYDTLPFGGAHVHGAVLGYPAPRMASRAHRLPPA